MDLKKKTRLLRRSLGEGGSSRSGREVPLCLFFPWNHRGTETQRRLGGIIIFCSLLGALLFCAAARAQDENPADASTAQSLEGQIRAVKGAIDREERKLRDLRKNQYDLERQLGKLVSEQEKVDAKQNALKKEIGILSDRELQLESALTANVAHLEELKRAFRRRTVANYKMLNEAAGISYLVSAASPTDLLRRTVYLARISRQDEAGISEMREQIGVIQDQRTELEQLKDRRSRQLASLNALQRDLQRNEEEKRQLLDRKQEEGRGLERALRSLTSTQRTLETMLEVLTGGEELPVPEETPVPIASPEPNVPPEPRPVPIRLLSRPEPFNGPGLESLRGVLLFPASGRLVQGFGMQRLEEFSEVLFHKGVEMGINPGTAVQAIAAGRVVVGQDLPGIGLTVIVDHGSRYYSLYGRLRLATHRRGDVIRKGESIGQAGPADSQGRNFYFELRYRGKAIDPGAFFKNFPAS